MCYGQLMPCHPSRFLKELPPELMEDADVRDKEPLNPDAGKKVCRRIGEILVGWSKGNSDDGDF